MDPSALTPTNKSAGALGNGTTTLVDYLVKQGKLTAGVAQKVKLETLQTGKSESDLLLEGKYVSETDLAAGRAAIYNIPFVDLGQTPISPEALSIVPQSVASRFSVIPVSIDREKRELYLAMANPLDIGAAEFVERKSKMRVKPMAAAPSLIEQFIAERYSTGLAQEVTEAIEEAKTPEEGGITTVDLARLNEVIHEPPIAKIVKELLEFAIRSRASDVHIEPEENTTRVRYRIDGILQEKFTMPKQFHDSVISRIKILSGMKIDEKRAPQDGRFNFKMETEEVDLRVSDAPTIHGEKIVMRLLKKSGGVPELPELGLAGKALRSLQDAIARPHGIIIICGPTGSGKTTTLYSILSKISTPKVNVVTLEDPVEYQISGVNQIQVNPAVGLTFATGLRSLVRQDPNIIMVGEIRDNETAQLAIQAALTGHLVFSTLHTSDAAGALPRLLDLGAEPFLLASTMTAVVGQRVVRRIHEDCKTGYVPEAKVVLEMKETLGPLFQEGASSDPVKLYKGKGDQEDGGTGYLGRVGIFEVMPVSEKIGQLLLERSPSAKIEKQAREEGMVTMKQDGYLKVLEGITTYEEVLRVAQE